MLNRFICDSKLATDVNVSRHDCLSLRISFVIDLPPAHPASHPNTAGTGSRLMVPSSFIYTPVVS